MAGRPPVLKHGEAFVATGSKKKCEHAISHRKRTSDVLLAEVNVQKKLKLRANKKLREREHQLKNITLKPRRHQPTPQRKLQPTS
jgi:hypothetical protein